MKDFNYYEIEYHKIEGKNEQEVQETFIKIYSNKYQKDTNKKAEDEITKLLGKNEFDKKDIFLIMAWKMGKIKAGKEQIEYFGNWDEEHIRVYKTNKAREEKNAKQILYETIDFENIAKTINKKKDTCDWKLNNWLDTFCNIKGMGPVYTITLRYFASHGKYPIYDRFADMALRAICGEYKDRKITDQKLEIPFELMPNYSKKNQEKIESRYHNYCKRIEKIFGLEKYRENRSIDQALWSYGHLFKAKKDSDFTD